MEAQIESIAGALLDPFLHITRPGQRIYWIYLVGATLLAGGVWLRTGQRRPVGFLRWLTARSIWLHPSARLDYQYVFTKAVFKTVAFAPLLGARLALAVWVVVALEAALGPASPLSLPGWGVAALYTAVLFVLSDLSRWIVHVLAHRVPALWALHQVHHSATVMTPLTLYRSHPLESLLFEVRGIAVTGLVAGIFFYGFGRGVVQIELLGVNVVGFVLNTLGGNLRHSHVRLSYPAWLERILISPAQHQLHHSDDPAHHHHNCGAWLAFWDRMAGRLLLSRDAQPRRFGLPPEVLNHAPTRLVDSLWRPVWSIIRPTRPAKVLEDSRTP